MCRSWSPLARMSRNSYETPSFRACLRILPLKPAIASRNRGFRPAVRAKAGSGGPAIPMAFPPVLSTRRDFSRFSPPRLSSTRS